MVNLWEETLGALAEEGADWSDVLWVGTRYWEIPKDVFERLANVEYDNDYGAPEVALDLKVVTNDGWLERVEYDGREWWEWKFPLRCPQKIRIPERIITNKIGWESLKEMNPPETEATDA